MALSAVIGITAGSSLLGIKGTATYGIFPVWMLFNRRMLRGPLCTERNSAINLEKEEGKDASLRLLIDYQHACTVDDLERS